MNTMKDGCPAITFAAAYYLVKQVTQPQHNARHRVQAVSLEHTRHETHHRRSPDRLVPYLQSEVLRNPD